MKQYLYILVCCFCLSVCAQDYTSYFIGSNSDLLTEPTFGLVLMGGASENDNAMRWFLERANGGDILVLRASGSDGYNDYFYSELGVTVNSVESIVINNSAGAVNNYVLEKIENAEAIWFAGGDQWNYINYFKNTEVENLINDHINVKQGVIGGTSAGMAILAEYYFSAENGTISSADALANPYDHMVALGASDFLNIPHLENTITDTHFDSPVRKGRSAAFLARMVTDYNIRSKGIASEEYTAICVDINGLARVYGSFPQEQDYAYFIQANCDDFTPENCVSGQPLEWNLMSKALRVYRVPGTEDGQYTFDLSDWDTATGGIWYNWWVEGGVFYEAETTSPECDALLIDEFNITDQLEIYPNPVDNEVFLSKYMKGTYELYNVQGAFIKSGDIQSDYSISTSNLQSGVYFLKVIGNEHKVLKFIKR